MKILTTITLLLFIFPIFGQINSFASFEKELSELLQNNVSEGRVDYKNIKASTRRNEIATFIENANTSALTDAQLKAFRINAYNFTVLNAIAEDYPIGSVQEIKGFFDKVKRKFEGKSFTLTNYEKELILSKFNDPRLHFAVNCGAIDCPPIIAEIYQGDNLDDILSLQTTKALNNPTFLRVADNKIELSQIFKWYPNDFGGSSATIIDFINTYRTNAINTDAKVSYYDYDWTLNDSNAINGGSGNSQFRYVVSSTIPQGTFEIKFFNNLYSQNVNDQRSTFFTTAFSGLYGLNNRINVGVAGRFRAVSNHTGDSSPFDVIGFRNTTSQRLGITALGPIVRIAPIESWENFSIQSTFTFPVGSELEGNPWIDWDGAFWNTQFFNDFTLSDKFSIFTELDVLIEDISFNLENASYRVSTPVVLIGSYFPNPKTTFYVISGYSPFWQQNFDYFYQAGAGAKYQFTPDFEIELLYTGFRNRFILENDGSASTFNLGIRFNI